MKLGYFIKEGLSGLGRATLSTAVAVITITIALGLLCIFLVITGNIGRMIEDIRSRVELEAFLDKSLNPIQIKAIGSMIQNTEGVDSLTYISKAEAAHILKEIMGADDLFDLIETNPLPASYKIKLKETHRTWEQVERVARTIERIEGVEEVQYQKQLLKTLDERIHTYRRINLIIGVLAALAAILLISNTIKLSIYAKRDVIRTMKLVGATNRFIAAPFLVEGIVQGIAGSALAVLLIYFLTEAVRKHILENIQVSVDTYLYTIGMGIALGLTGSFLSIRFFLKENIEDR